MRKTGRALRARPATPDATVGAISDRAVPSFSYVALSDEADELDDELLLDDDERLLLDELLERELLDRDELLDDDRELDDRLDDDELLAADELLDDELLAAALDELDELLSMPVGEAGELPHPARPDAATAPVSRSRNSRRGRLDSRSFLWIVMDSTGVLSDI